MISRKRSRKHMFSFFTFLSLSVPILYAPCWRKNSKVAALYGDCLTTLQYGRRISNLLIYSRKDTLRHVQYYVIVYLSLTRKFCAIIYIFDRYSTKRTNRYNGKNMQIKCIWCVHIKLLIVFFLKLTTFRRESGTWICALMFQVAHILYISGTVKISQRNNYSNDQYNFNLHLYLRVIS